MRMLRWILFLPAALLASAMIYQLGWLAALLCAGGSVLLWVPVGALAAYAFFDVAFTLAPLSNAIVKWSCVFVAAAISISALIDSLFSTRQLTLAAACAPMIAAAVYHATRATKHASDPSQRASPDADARVAG
jgi:hypothetical protein